LTKTINKIVWECNIHELDIEHPKCAEITAIKKYDNYSQLTEEINFKESDFFEKINYEWEYRKLKKKVTITKKDSIVNFESFYYKYNSEGLPIEEICLSNDNNIYKNTSEYNENGDIIRKTYFVFSPFEQVINEFYEIKRIEYFYDQSTVFREEIQFLHDATIKNTYDENGKILKSTYDSIYGSSDNDSSETIEDYDFSGNKYYEDGSIKEAIIDTNSNKSHTYYNKIGKIVKQIIYPLGDCSYTSEKYYKYDILGNRIIETTVIDYDEEYFKDICSKIYNTSNKLV